MTDGNWLEHQTTRVAVGDAIPGDQWLGRFALQAEHRLGVTPSTRSPVEYILYGGVRARPPLGGFGPFLLG